MPPERAAPSRRAAGGALRAYLLLARSAPLWLLHSRSVRRLAAAAPASHRPADRPRVIATACHDFPIYSQTFVYQELHELVRGGFDLRFLYSELGSRSGLPARFSELWNLKHRSFLSDRVGRIDRRRFARSAPERVEALTRRICDASGLAHEALLEHPHFNQAFSFARLAAAFRPDYLHSYFFYERTLFCLVAAELLDLPRGVSCYADHLLDDYELKMMELQIASCDIVVATSARIREELLSLCPAKDPDDILVKPNAIDARRFPVVERSGPRGSEPFRLLTVSRLEPKKGLLDLVEAVARLRGDGLAIEARIIGEADAHSESSLEYERRLRQRVDELDLAGSFHLLGRRPQSEIVAELGSAHLFVAPFVELESGDKDGIPTALLEAMATGIAVVATDAGSIPEVIDDDREGVLVRQRRSDQLAEAIGSLRADPARRRSLGERAGETIRRRFDVSVCEGAFHDRIRHCLAERHAGGRGAEETPSR